MAKITTEELQRRIAAYKKELKENGGIPRIPSKEEQDEFFENLDKFDDKTRLTIFDKFLNGNDYSTFQDFDYYTRAMLGLTNTNLIKSVANGDYSLNNKKLLEVLDKYAYNPAMREGISILKHTDSNFKKIDEYMNQILFNKTLDIPSKEQRENVFKTVYAKPHFKEITRLEGLDIIIKNVKKNFEKIQSGKITEESYFEKLSATSNPYPRELYKRMKDGTFDEAAEYEKINNDIAKEKEKAELLRNIEEAEYNKTLESQKVMAKILFMTQLSKYDVKDKNGNAIDYKDSIADTFAHGGRTNFILPHGENQQQMQEAIFGQNPEKTSGFKQRTAATHHINRRKVENNSILKESKETIGNVIQSLSNSHFGMNIAVGGYGITAPNKKPSLADGTSGHMYCRKELGDKNHCGSLLIGFESCETGKTSVTGHKHTARATTSKQSAFLADKFGVGKNIDGRTVDLSGLSPTEFIKVMNNFDKVYSDLQKEAHKNDAAREKLSSFNKFLTGARLDAEALKTVLIEVGMDAHILNKSITCARTGLESRKNSAEKQNTAPDKNTVDQFLTNFNNALNKVNIDLSENDSWKRLKFMEKVNGKWTIQPVFLDEKLTNEQKYLKINAILNSNDTTLMAYNMLLF